MTDYKELEELERLCGVDEAHMMIVVARKGLGKDYDETYEIKKIIKQAEQRGKEEIVNRLNEINKREDSLIGLPDVILEIEEKLKQEQGD